jgi:hypothetical protein
MFESSCQFLKMNTDNISIIQDFFPSSGAYCCDILHGIYYTANSEKVAPRKSQTLNFKLANSDGQLKLFLWLLTGQIILVHCTIVHYSAYFVSCHSCNAKFASKKPKSILSVYKSIQCFLTPNNALVWIETPTSGICRNLNIYNNCYKSQIIKNVAELLN